MIVDVFRSVGVAALTVIDFSRIQRQAGAAARAHHLKGCALYGVKEVIMVMLVRFNGFAGLQRELPKAHAFVLEYQLGSHLGHLAALQKNDVPPRTLRRNCSVASSQKYRCSTRRAWSLRQKPAARCLPLVNR